VVLLSFTTSGAQATTVVPPDNPGELARHAELVVLARALGNQVTGTWPALSTQTGFEAIELLKGSVIAGQTFAVTVPGGERDGQGWLVAGRPRFQEGQNYLLFLRQSEAGLWQPVVSSYGLLKEETGAGGKTPLLAPLAEAVELETAPVRDPMAFDEVGTYMKDRLLPHLRDVIAGRERWNTAAVLAPETAKAAPRPLATPSGCSFYTVGGEPVRWDAFDQHRAITIFADETGDATLAGGGFAELEGAISDWNSINGSSIRVEYAGKRGVSVGCTNKGIDAPPLGTNIVVWNDPCSDIPNLTNCVGTTAVAGPYYSTAVHSFDGRPWKTIVGWFVIVNNGSSCFGSGNYRNLLAHELGHGLGFDHVSDPAALMNARCCNKANQTDLTCARYLYPGEVRPEPTRETLIVPVVVDATATTGNARYSSELTLTNEGTATVTATIFFRPSGEGAGPEVSGNEALRAGSQTTLPDVLSWLRRQGSNSLTATSVSQMGTLRIELEGSSQPGLVHASVRTTAATSDPYPEGAAGLSYTASSPATYSQTSATVFGLRSTEEDRSNLAVFNPGAIPVTVRVTAWSGDGSGRSAVVSDAMTVPAYGWIQFNRVLDAAEITNGWVTVERTSESGQFGTYGVVNDNATNDGSFIDPVRPPAAGRSLTVPVLVETSVLRSELILANLSGDEAEVTLEYVESGSPSQGPATAATVLLAPRTQLILPEAIQFLRELGLVDANREGTHLGSVRVTVSRVPLSAIFAGARTASLTAAGGRFGLFTPCVYEGEEATTHAQVLGLRSDGMNRSNVAVINASVAGGSSVTLELRTHDGDAEGLERGMRQTVTLLPGQFRQFNNILASNGIRNGWVSIERVSGSAPWLAYGVVNDGASPGERTGDGAYISMVKR
jgi:hypothetical protein